MSSGREKVCLRPVLLAKIQYLNSILIILTGFCKDVLNKIGQTTVSKFNFYYLDWFLQECFEQNTQKMYLQFCPTLMSGPEGFRVMARKCLKYYREGRNGMVKRRRGVLASFII